MQRQWILWKHLELILKLQIGDYAIIISNRPPQIYSAKSPLLFFLFCFFFAIFNCNLIFFSSSVRSLLLFILFILVFPAWAEVSSTTQRRSTAITPSNNRVSFIFSWKKIGELSNWLNLLLMGNGVENEDDL